MLICPDNEGSVLSSCDLHEHYKAFVQTRTDDAKVQGISNSYRRFTMALKSHARQEKWEEVTDQKRGYKVKLARDQRNASSNQCDIKGMVANFLSQTTEQKKEQAKYYMRRLLLGYVDGQPNYGAFSNVDIPINTIIAEYIGEEITRQEGDKREAKYKECQGKKNVTMFFVANNICFDGYKTPNGEEITINDNPGTWLNHKKINPNCKPVSLRTADGLRIVIMTIRQVAQHEELRWNYDDTRKNLASWMYV
jgi:hypothetical protein